MRIGQWFKWQPLMMITLLTGPVGGFAFSLLGPYADWMDVQKGYQLAGDIGGPMNIGEGYRWNMPVVTYGFDRSFLDYFGSNGVAAVEGAIGILNALPPASSVVLTNYPLAIWSVNNTANALNLVDLKSVTLFFLLEQMGLADPIRYAYCIRDFEPGSSGTNYTFEVILRNFDPASAQPSGYVNDKLYSYYIKVFTLPPPPTNVFCEAIPLLVDVTENGLPFVPAASVPSTPGVVLTNVSRDDVAGLRYLLSGSQIRCESLLPDVHLAGTNDGSLVRTADRPGIEKVTFVRHPFGSLNGEFKPFTNRWTDIYYDWDAPVYQEVERVTTSPDILFSGSDLAPAGFVAGLAATRTGTANWANNATLNENSGGAGPGVIQPPIRITYNTVGRFYVNTFDPARNVYLLDQVTASLGYSWGSFDGSTNLPIVYPDVQIAFQPTQVDFRLLLNGGTNDFHWLLSGAAYGRFFFQTATNLRNWATLTALTNSGEVFSYQFQAATNEASRFFRTIQQP
jgi:hypothetical protein